MSLFATAGRMLRQISHDHRTLGIITLIPIVILTLMHYIFDERQPQVSILEAQLLVIFPITIMFLLTAIAMVRERTSGTLERLMTTPIGRVQILGGYALAFGTLAAWQASVSAVFCYWVLGLELAGSAWQLLLTAVISAQLGVAFGLLSSAISRSEFQAVQMYPVLIIPQLLLCGLLGPREKMADWLHAISNWLPMTYGVEAMANILNDAEVGADFWINLGIVAGCVIALLGLASATLQRRTA